MDLPAELEAALSGGAFHRVTLGESGTAVWRCTFDGRPSLYLKTAPVGTDQRLDHEAARLRWMSGGDLPVPTVRDYVYTGGVEYLLLDEVRGVAASDAQWTAALPEVVAAIAGALWRLHRTSIADCPFDQRIARQIDEARRRVALGLVREDDFDDVRLGRTAVEVFEDLVTSVPNDEGLVFTHGDCCLPNIILRRDRPDGAVEVAGWIDCGRAGIADRHQDIALACRSIEYNYGAEWVSPFLVSYGLPAPSREKMRFFELLDEFF